MTLHLECPRPDSSPHRGRRQRPPSPPPEGALPAHAQNQAVGLWLYLTCFRRRLRQRPVRRAGTAPTSHGSRFLGARSPHTSLTDSCRRLRRVSEGGGWKGQAEGPAVLTSIWAAAAGQPKALPAQPSLAAQLRTPREAQAGLGLPIGRARRAGSRASGPRRRVEVGAERARTAGFQAVASGSTGAGRMEQGTARATEGERRERDTQGKKGQLRNEVVAGGNGGACGLVGRRAAGKGPEPGGRWWCELRAVAARELAGKQSGWPDWAAAAAADTPHMQVC